MERLREENQNLRAENAAMRASLCEYQLKYWTLAYRTTQFFRPLLGDDDEDWTDEKGGEDA